MSIILLSPFESIVLSYKTESLSKSCLETSLNAEKQELTAGKVLPLFSGSLLFTIPSYFVRIHFRPYRHSVPGAILR